MNELHYTLLSDGPTDKALMPILKWLLQQRLVNVPIQPHWADLRRLRRPPRELHEKIQKSVEVYPVTYCLFIATMRPRLWGID